jgi:Trypsin-co-occurring domain 1
MEQLLRFEAGERSVLVEVADDEPGIERAARVDDVVVKASQSLESALEQVRVLADVTLARLGGLARQPEQVEVEFGVRLNAEAGAVIARTQAEGHLQVKLTWTGLERARRPPVHE